MSVFHAAGRGQSSPGDGSGRRTGAKPFRPYARRAANCWHFPAPAGSRRRRIFPERELMNQRRLASGHFPQRLQPSQVAPRSFR
jgi:hypothetical protein